MSMNFFRALFFSLIFLITQLYSTDSVAFSKKEKESLELLFDYLFKFENFSYTLFSDKPISFHDVFTESTKKTSIKNYIILLSYTKSINFLETSWRLWQSKYLKTDFNNYVFFEKKKSDQTTIILINKKAVSKSFKANQKLFQQVLGSDLTEDKLLNRIMSDEFSLKESLNNHEGLLGILLGYGTSNAMLFQKKQNAMKQKDRVLSPEFSKATSSKISRDLLPVNNFFGWFSVIQPVRFMAKIDHPETQKLIKKYAKDNSTISQIYRDRNLVDVIISKLNED